MEDTSEEFSWVKAIFGFWGILVMIAFLVCLIPGFYLGLGMGLNGRGTDGWLEYYRSDVVESFQEQFQWYFQQYGWGCLLGYSFILPILPGGVAGMFVGGYLGAALPRDIAIGILVFTAFILFCAAAEKATVSFFAITGYIGVGYTGTVVSAIGIGLLIFL